MTYTTCFRQGQNKSLGKSNNASMSAIATAMRTSKVCVLIAHDKDRAVRSMTNSLNRSNLEYEYNNYLFTHDYKE